MKPDSSNPRFSVLRLHSPLARPPSTRSGSSSRIPIFPQVLNDYSRMHSPSRVNLCFAGRSQVASPRKSVSFAHSAGSSPSNVSLAQSPRHDESLCAHVNLWEAYVPQRRRTVRKGLTLVQTTQAITNALTRNYELALDTRTPSESVAPNIKQSRRLKPQSLDWTSPRLGSLPFSIAPKHFIASGQKITLQHKLSRTRSKERSWIKRPTTQSP